MARPDGKPLPGRDLLPARLVVRPDCDPASVVSVIPVHFLNAREPQLSACDSVVAALVRVSTASSRP
jgi:hypothetical protein